MSSSTDFKALTREISGNVSQLRTSQPEVMQSFNAMGKAALAPGAIDTPMLRRSFGRAADPAAAEAKSVARHPLARLGRPEEIAEAALYLAGDAASFTTGTTLAVDGGWLAG